MLSVADTDITEIISLFNNFGVESTFLVATETAMKKGIIDAIKPLRDYFRNKGFHDYDKQDQGPEGKIVVESFFVGAKELIPTKTSLYRPKTKTGDPRIWFYKLPKIANPENLLAIIIKDGTPFILNCSDPDVIASIANNTSPLFKALALADNGLSGEANELLGMLRTIGGQGWVPNLRAGPTGVGYTLETMLGIPANSSKAPDYKGIEIKAGRVKSGNKTLFTKTPNWKLSRLKSSTDIMIERGRFAPDRNRHQLYHSIYANKPNSYDLQLDVDLNKGILHQVCHVADVSVKDVLWEFQTLQDALSKKHKETFWVDTKTRLSGADEEFFYYKGVYTRSPNVDAFPLLIAIGEVFIDYRIFEKSPGKAADKGYAFRMKKTKLESLFGKPKAFDLVA